MDNRKIAQFTIVFSFNFSTALAYLFSVPSAVLISNMVAGSSNGAACGSPGIARRNRLLCEYHAVGVLNPVE
jgi:hypothetical protein